MSSGKQEGGAGRPLMSSRVMSSKDRSGAVANNGSFRVYYSLGAGTVPFVWETKPGTPKSAAAARADGYDAPPPPPPMMMISPPPSYQSRTRKAYATRRATAKSSSDWPSRWLPAWMARWLGVRSRLWPSSSSADGDRWLAPVNSGDDDVQGRRPRRRAVLMCF